jgi:hypothetical protein
MVVDPVDEGIDAAFGGPRLQIGHAATLSTDARSGPT